MNAELLAELLAAARALLDAAESDDDDRIARAAKRYWRAVRSALGYSYTATHPRRQG